MCLFFFVGDFLQILLQDSSPWKTTIWGLGNICLYLLQPPKQANQSNVDQDEYQLYPDACKRCLICAVKPFLQTKNHGTPPFAIGNASAHLGFSITMLDCREEQPKTNNWFFGSLEGYKANVSKTTLTYFYFEMVMMMMMMVMMIGNRSLK